VRAEHAAMLQLRAQLEPAVSAITDSMEDLRALLAAAAAASGAPQQVVRVVGGRVDVAFHVILQSKHQLITAGMDHVTHLTPGKSQPWSEEARTPR
jgi:hypothetical protein